MREQCGLILLLIAISLVQSRGSTESVAVFHARQSSWQGRIIERSGHFGCAAIFLVNFNHHSPERRLIELQIEHADLDAGIDRLSEQSPSDQLMMQRLKKRRLALRDLIVQLERSLDPKEPA